MLAQVAVAFQLTFPTQFCPSPWMLPGSSPFHLFLFLSFLWDSLASSPQSSFLHVPSLAFQVRTTVTNFKIWRFVTVISYQCSKWFWIAGCTHYFSCCRHQRYEKGNLRKEEKLYWAFSLRMQSNDFPTPPLKLVLMVNCVVDSSL